VGVHTQGEKERKRERREKEERRKAKNPPSCTLLVIELVLAAYIQTVFFDSLR